MAKTPINTLFLIKNIEETHQPYYLRALFIRDLPGLGAPHESDERRQLVLSTETGLCSTTGLKPRVNS